MRDTHVARQREVASLLHFLMVFATSAYLVYLNGGCLGAAVVFFLLSYARIGFCAVAALATIGSSGLCAFLGEPIVLSSRIFYLLLTGAAAFFAWRNVLVDTETANPTNMSLRSRVLSRSRGLLAPLGVLLMLSTLFRRFEVIDCLCLGLLLLLFDRALPSKRREDRGSCGSAVVKTCLLLFSSAVALILLEFGARVALPPRPNLGGTAMPHPVYIHLLKPNSRGVFYVRAENRFLPDVVKVISPQGIRDRVFGPKGPDEFRIAMLGDSFTLGHAVPIEQSIPKRLEHALASEHLSKRVSVINCGIGGAGPLQELGMLVERALPLDPDLVILQTFEGNDIADSLLAVRRVLRSYSVEERGFMPFPQDWGLGRYRAETALREHSRLYREVTARTGNTKWVMAFANACRLFSPYTEPHLPPSAPRPFFQEQNLAEWYPELEEGMALFAKFVREIRDVCQAHGIDVIAYSIPELATVDDARWEELVTTYEGRYAYERGKALRAITALLDREGIPHFSIYELLHDQSNPHETYFPMNRHLTELGNDLVARRIRDYLMRTYFPSKGMLSPENDVSHEAAR